jgi:hypothetical protein
LAVNHLNKFQAASCQHLLHAAGQWLEPKKKYQGDSEGSPRQRSCFLLCSCYLSSLSAWPLLKATKMPIELTKRWWWEQLMSGKKSQYLPIKANSSKEMKDLWPKSLEISWNAMANHGSTCISPHCLPPGTCRKRGEP